ncbi:MAG: hypothetical protein KDK90_27960 [Leptospiraceae bacterium]|nr:hypothetical protein [Leptospiraceae bacterium]
MISIKGILFFLAFGFVSIIVWLTRGKNQIWIKRKLYIGGLILSLTTMGTENCITDTMTCHDSSGGSSEIAALALLLSSSENNAIVFDKSIQSENGKTIIVSLSNGTQIKAQVTNITSEHFSFFILDRNEKVLQYGNIEAEDGKFDSITESFIISLDSSIAEGDYNLKIYANAANEIISGSINPIKKVSLHVTQ